MFQSAIFTIPAKDINLAPWAGVVLDQGNEGSCVANSGIGNMNLLTIRLGLVPDYSVLGVHQATLIAEGRVGQQGVAPTDLFNVLKNEGVGKGSVWAYNLDSSGDVQHLADAPPASYYNNMTKITSFTQLAIDPDNSSVLRNQIDLALSEGRPISVSFTAENWLRFMNGPLKDQQTNLIGHFDTTPLGGHDLLITGRDSTVNGGSYVFKNSWGTSWGDNGYGEMSVTWASSFTTAIVIDGIGTHDFTYTPDKQFLAQAYVAGLDRAVDYGGLTYWAGELVTHSKVQILDTIVSLTDNATKTASQFVSDLYHNVLGRAADADGFAYWTGKLAAGESKGGVMLDIINAVNAYTGTDTGGVYSRNLFENKSAQSAYYGIQLEANDVTVAHQALVGITDDPNSVQVTRVGISQALGWDHIT